MNQEINHFPIRSWVNYGLAVAVTLLTLWIRADVSAFFSNRPLLILLPLPIIVSAVMGGVGPGLISTLIAAVGSAYAFTPQSGLWIANIQDQIQWTFLVVNGVAVSVLSELLHRSRQSAEFNLRNEIDAISALTNTEHDLRVEHARLSAVVNSVADAIIGQNLDGVVTSWNVAAERIFGYPAKTAMGQTISSLIVPVELQHEEADILARASHGHATPPHTTVRHRHDGTRIDVSLSVSPIHAGDGSIVGATKTVRDITDERRIEGRFRLAVDAVGIGIWIWHLKFNTLTLDERIVNMFGLSLPAGKNVVDYDDWISHLHPDDRGAFETQLRLFVTGAGRCEPTFRIILGDGQVRWIRAAAIIEYDSMGNPVQVVGTSLDITDEILARNKIIELNATLEGQVSERTADLKAALRSLHDQEKFIRTITDALPLLIGYWDAELRLRFANAAYRNWFGKSSEEILGTTAQELMGEALFSKTEPSIRAVMRGEEQSFEQAHFKGDGSKVYFLATYIPDVLDSQVRGFYVMAADITPLKLAEFRLENLNVELERRAAAAEDATRAKSAFLATMSHELRTPLNAIIGFSGTLLMRLAGPLTPDQERQLGIIKKSGKHLLMLVNDILDISSVEAGKMVLTPAAFAPRLLLDEVQEQFKEAAKVKGLQLTLDWNGPPNPGYLADHNRLRQMLNNLVSNAVKFTEHGHIKVEGHEETRQADEAVLLFSVEDTGMGIPSEKQSLLFQRFVQVDNSSTRSHGGSGLGLSIVRSLAQLMKGDAGLESEMGKGSRFWLRIRVGIQPANS